MRVDVYRNLNKPGIIFSIRHKGKVIDWRQEVFIRNVTAKHPSPKQINAVRTGARQVCAWLKGDLCDETPPSGGELLKFDPKTDDRFPFDRCEWVHFTPAGIFYSQ